VSEEVIERELTEIILTQLAERDQHQTLAEMYHT